MSNTDFDEDLQDEEIEDAVSEDADAESTDTSDGSSGEAEQQTESEVGSEREVREEQTESRVLSRGERRFQRLANETREANTRAERLERELRTSELSASGRRCRPRNENLLPKKCRYGLPIRLFNIGWTRLPRNSIRLCSRCSFRIRSQPTRHLSIPFVHQIQGLRNMPMRSRPVFWSYDGRGRMPSEK